MHNIDTIYFFTFIFTILVTIKNCSKFIGGMIQKEPKPLAYSNKELILLGISISYIITYLYIK